MNGTGQWMARLETSTPTPGLRVVPEPGRPQPEVSEGPSRKVVFDGRLYDHAELRRELAGGELSRIETQADLIRYGHERLGERLLSRLKGAFSLLIWDGETSTLLCVRDALGVHPLFWARCASGIAISPWLDVLVRDPGIPTALNRLVAAGHLLDLPPAPEETHFTAIRRVPAGHVLRIRRGEITSWRHWDPAPLYSETDAPHPEEFGPVLRRAVGRSLDVGPGAIMLSGGVDSATVAAAAAELSEERGLPRPRALSIVSPDRASSEEGLQRRIATALRLPHSLATAYDRVPRGQLLPRALALASSTATPPGILAPVYAALMTEAGQRGCKVVLNGDGGDEWLLPPPRWTADRLLHLDVRALYGLWRSWCRYYPNPGPTRVLHGLLWRWGARPLLRATAGVGLQRLSASRLRRLKEAKAVPPLPDWIALSPTFLRELGDWAMANAPEVAPGDLYEHAKRAQLQSPGLLLGMEEAFVARRRFSLPVLKPLLDPDVVEFLYRLHPTALISGGLTKAPARAFLSARLPFAADWPKATADPAWQLLVRSEGAVAWDSLGGIEMLSGAGIVDERALDLFVRERIGGVDPRQATLLWETMSLESWLKPRIVGT